MPKKKVYQADVVTYDLCLNNLHEDFDKKKKITTLVSTIRLHMDDSFKIAALFIKMSKPPIFLAV